MTYDVEERLPTIQEFERLCRSVGWGEIMNFKAAGKGLPNSVYGVVALDSEREAVGMGRIVGDGALYYYIQDIAVHPDHQRKGLGTRILTALFAYLKEHASPRSFIALFSVPEAVDFYRRFTLEERDMIGLFTVKELIVNKGV